MASEIHATAIIGKKAELGENVKVGPFAVIEDGAKIGNGCSIGASAYIGTLTTIGDETTIFNGASVGTVPQDLKYRGEETTLVIGKNNIIREFCTINRGTIDKGTTVIGDNCALLAYCHVAHDCILGNHVVISNGLSMAGHVTVGDYVVIGGDTAIHQFCRIGSYTMVGARSYITKDVVPFALCAKGEAGAERIVGINKVGLERRGFDEARRRVIKNSYKTLFRSGKSLDVALVELSAEVTGNPDIDYLLAFIRESGRGLYNMDLGSSD